MSNDGYLPDGCNENDVPGNTPGDINFNSWLNRQDFGELAIGYAKNNIPFVEETVLEAIANGDFLKAQFDDWVEKRYHDEVGR